jgi:hypothetical protein
MRPGHALQGGRTVCSGKIRSPHGQARRFDPAHPHQRRAPPRPGPARASPGSTRPTSRLGSTSPRCWCARTSCLRVRYGRPMRRPSRSCSGEWIDLRPASGPQLPLPGLCPPDDWIQAPGVAVRRSRATAPDRAPLAVPGDHGRQGASSRRRRQGADSAAPRRHPAAAGSVPARSCRTMLWRSPAACSRGSTCVHRLSG